MFDTLGGSQLANAFQAVKPGGKVVSISGLPNRAFAQQAGLPMWKQLVFSLATAKIRRLQRQFQVGYEFLFMKSSGTQLAKITKMVEHGTLQPFIDRVVPFSDIQPAMDYSAAGRSVGKIVIKMA